MVLFELTRFFFLNCPSAFLHRVQALDEINVRLMRSTDFTDIVKLWLGMNTKQNREAVWILFEKLVSNIVANEGVEKFRKIKVTFLKSFPFISAATYLCLFLCNTAGIVSSQDYAYGVLS